MATAAITVIAAIKAFEGEISLAGDILCSVE